MSSRTGYVKRLEWPLLATALLMATGMAYSLFWPAVVDGKSFYWNTPPDLWATVRTAHYIGWDALSYVYSSHSGLVTLPGFPLLLTPVAMLASALGLSQSVPGILIPKPEAWLLIGPFILLISGVAFVALDLLARRLGVPAGRRPLLMLAEVAAIWPAVVIWGHPEDVLALAFLAFAYVAGRDGRWRTAAWMLGLAISFQLLAILLVPILLALAGSRRAGPLLARAALLPGFLLVAVLVRDPHTAMHALLDQPNYPTVDHATPWVLLSPSLGRGVVAAGPGRLVALAVAALAAWPAARWRGNPARLVWLGAAVLAGRCLFESVMVPYYVMPAVALAFLSAGISRSHVVRQGACLAAGLGVTVMTFSRADMWAWWFEMAALLLGMLAFAFPSSNRAAPPTVTIQETDLELAMDRPGTESARLGDLVTVGS